MALRTTQDGDDAHAHIPWTEVSSNAPWSAEISPAIEATLHLNDSSNLQANDADIIVIGAGIAGLSAAAAAVQAGARTLVLDEAPAIGHGATGRNAGIMSAGINMGLAELPPDSPHRQMWIETSRELLALAEEASRPESPIAAHLTGALSLAESPFAARRLEREARARMALGLRAEMWTPAQVNERVDGRLNTSQVVEALWLPDEGRVNPLTLLARFASDARSGGAVLAGGARVTGWETQAAGRKGAHWRVTLEGGRVLTARALVVATGPVKSANARIYAVAFDIDLPETFPLFWDAAPFTYADYRPGAGRVITSGGRYGKAGGSPREANYYLRLAEGVRHWLPELVHANPTYAWAVDLDVTADLAPTARDLEAAAPGVAIEGLGALGVLPGIILGRQTGERLARMAQ